MEAALQSRVTHLSGRLANRARSDGPNAELNPNHSGLQHKGKRNIEVISRGLAPEAPAQWRCPVTTGRGSAGNTPVTMRCYSERELQFHIHRQGC
ncbi:hypothetical protein SKAU_G00047790 [Synaphobranchus kaupii]|uniref:Uncharacterized protein n=1 Tax=Synaphobranchus kaupii TaxID=118154 RepID=A0A9Q1G3F2_SYNKA|nr:hypothetical protein SKAU_G00047790 [Synaphobranchus kaupii]